NVWSYDFGTGEDFIEIEIEPNALPTAAKAQTVGVKSIKITPLAVNEKGDKPTIHILGDSTQKTYSFNETISSWGQTLGNYFDKDKVNVINYSMGGRAMKSNYNEGRFDEILIRGKKGDFVFIHSAHNDETVSTGRYVRGASVGNNLADNNANYNVWLDMYIKAIKARGMTPVLVTAMPRNAGLPTENADKPNGFNPDSPGMMRAKAASDPAVGFVELYAGAKEYFTKLERNEGIYIYNYLEAGETPAENAANGTNSDGTHYREAAAKQFCRIMLQSIYDQANVSTDTYNDKAIMDELLSYMPESVVSAAETKDWSAVFPEMASDVSAVDVVPGATKQASSNYYYRTAIEKVLQLGALHKDADNNFKPTETITVGEFARGIETVFGLPENSLTSYTKTYAEIQAEGVKPAELSISAADEAVIATASDSDIMTADAEGDLTVTVEQPVGGKVTIYNESQHAAETLDFTTSITSKQVIDREYFTFTAPEVIVSNTDKSGAYADNTAISTGYIETAQTSSITNKFAMYEAKASGTLTVYLRFDASKQIKLENTGNGNVQQTYINDALEAGSGNVYGTVHFNVEAGQTYKFYSQGGTSRVFGMMFEAGYPQSTTSLAANSGDQIRIVASADNGYVLNSITVNGDTAATTREHIITVTEDTTVSATFDKEPEVVAETLIASDAALTREAMGAILYDAYLAAYGKNSDGSWNKVAYMNQNGGVPSPDDPNYDPNIPYEGSPYTPLQGWGTLVDKDDLSLALYAKVKEAYNLGLMRSEQGIGRGSIAVGNELEPTAVVTRAKAAKTLAFCYVLTQPTSGESQIIPDNHNYAAEKAAPILTPNPDAPSTPYTTN
ncbi:MAG: S-layer homology domain-containing protein, partial [Oscillospiraceae bacterium]|nr:S-layer homology domain-containing protein [Oscillospiraceae bacterium]